MIVFIHIYVHIFHEKNGILFSTTYNIEDWKTSKECSA